jgi:peptide/nickel transport system permease protein
VPTWGELLSSDLQYLAQQPWAPLFPGLLIMITAGALNALADAVRDVGGIDQLIDSHPEKQEAADAFAPAL